MTFKAPNSLFVRSWGGNESHALPCGQFHYTRTSIGVGVTVETIAAWIQKNQAEPITGSTILTERTEVTIGLDEPTTYGGI
jgi:hypothetical protein